MATRTIEVFDDTLSPPRPCAGFNCRAKIVWAEVVSSGKKMCFTAPAVPLRTRHDESGRLVAVMAFEDNHWASCVDRARFKR